jgi:hypothetical protein
VQNPYRFAKVGRFVRASDGDVYFAECFIKGPPKETHVQALPTDARRGQLRVQRSGTQLRLLVADPPGAEFREVLRSEFGAEDVDVVRFIVANKDSSTAIDARLVDLRLSGPQQAAPVPAAPQRRRWLSAAVLLGLILGVGSLIAWRWRRRT